MQWTNIPLSRSLRSLPQSVHDNHRGTLPYESPTNAHSQPPEYCRKSLDLVGRNFCRYELHCVHSPCGGPTQLWKQDPMIWTSSEELLPLHLLNSLLATSNRTRLHFYPHYRFLRIFD